MPFRNSIYGTVTSTKRELTPGTPVRVVNHVLPELSRLTTVHPRSSTVKLATYVTNQGGNVVASYTNWPKAADFRAGDTPDTFHIDSDGEPFLTITVLPDASEVPVEYGGTLDPYAHAPGAFCDHLLACGPTAVPDAPVRVDRRKARRLRRRAARLVAA